ncbi:MAG: YdbL family protein [Alphaproteobacteria bacterium]
MMARTPASILAALLFALGLALAPAVAEASPLDDAKAAGWVGERPDGYLGVVPGAPASAQALVSDINAKRQAKYESVAQSQNTDLQAVEVVAGEKLIKRAKPGEYIMTPSGQWVRK